LIGKEFRPVDRPIKGLVSDELGENPLRNPKNSGGLGERVEFRGHVPYPASQ
jgi:hypothetical protein